MKIHPFLTSADSGLPESSFIREITLMEVLRLKLLFWTVLISFTLGMVRLFLGDISTINFVNQFLDIFTLVILLLLIYAAAAGYYVRKRIGRKRTISNTYEIVTVVVETTLPILYAYLLSLKLGNVYVLFSPVLLLYYLFIVLSTLRLSFWYSLVTGIISALQYYFLSLYIIHKSNMELILPITGFASLTYGRTIVLLTCGVASAFVAREIRKKIGETVNIIHQRNRIRHVLGQHVSNEIMEEIIREESALQPQRQMVCVLFLDVRDFTPMTDGISPEEIMDFQNKLFGMMIGIVNKYHGIINQFMGDGFMSTFGAPVSYGNDCVHAVNAALEILGETRRIGEEQIIPVTRLGIGIHYGLAVTGNVGTELRKQYSVTGSVVIEASRIEELNKEYQSQLLVSRDVYDQLGSDHPGESLGEIMLKGKSKPLEIMRIV